MLSSKAGSCRKKIFLGFEFQKIWATQDSVLVRIPVEIKQKLPNPKNGKFFLPGGGGASGCERGSHKLSCDGLRRGPCILTACTPSPASPEVRVGWVTPDGLHGLGRRVDPGLTSRVKSRYVVRLKSMCVVWEACDGPTNFTVPSTAQAEQNDFWKSTMGTWMWWKASAHLPRLPVAQCVIEAALQPSMRDKLDESCMD